MTLKERIQLICKERKIPIYKVEDDLNFSRGYISKLNQSNPNSGKILMIAEYLGVTPNYLLTGKEAVPSLNEKQEQLLSIARQLTPENQELLIELAATLLRKSEEK